MLVPAGSVTVTAGGGTLTAGGVTLTACGDTLTAGGDTLTAGGGTLTAGGVTLTAGGDTLTAGDTGRPLPAPAADVRAWRGTSESFRDGAILSSEDTQTGRQTYSHTGRVEWGNTPTLVRCILPSTG